MYRHPPHHPCSSSSRSSKREAERRAERSFTVKQNNPRQQQQQQQQLPTSTKMQTFRCIMHIMKESSILASSCQTFHEALNLGFGKLLKVSPVKSGIIWKVVRIERRHIKQIWEICSYCCQNFSKHPDHWLHQCIFP